MQIICISRGSKSYGQEFAVRLAQKLGYDCISREDLLSEAIKYRIPIGKLETAIIKPHTLTASLVREIEHYKALATSIICERALKSDIVYHGRTGHLLLPGISHIFKIRVVTDYEYRLKAVMQNLDISRDKAERYLYRIEEDRRRWVKKFYNVDWDVFTLYDLVLNLSQVNIDNMATAVCSMAQLPEFQSTPASIKALENLYLTSKARLKLARDKATCHMNLRVRVTNRNANVTFFRQEVKEPDVIGQVLSGLEEIDKIVCTEANTNILWIQEHFEPSQKAYGEIVNLARRWGAAVELLKINPCDMDAVHVDSKNNHPMPLDGWPESGILDEEAVSENNDSKDVENIYERLISDGVAGGIKIIKGNQKALVNSIDRTIDYRLIILDNLFFEKGESARKRLQQEWANFLSDSLKRPVLSLSELIQHYRFGVPEFLRMLIFGGMVALALFIIFHFQSEILFFLREEGLKWKILSAIFVFAFVPLYAYIYSRVTSLLLRLIKLE